MKKFLLLITLLVCGFSFGQTYTQVTTLAGLTDGNYLIVGDDANDGLMINSSNSTPYIDYSPITNPGTSITSGFTSANVFIVTVTSGVITIYNSSVGYASWGRSGVTDNNANFYNGAVATTEQWTPSVASGLWTLANVATPARILQWNNSSPRFAAYTSNQVKLKLYKEAVSTPCTGTPSPGNTISSETTVVSGGTTNLSLQNATTGSGVTYQWQSSTISASTGFANIDGATNATYIAIVNAKTWYKCVVTCNANIGNSSEVLVEVVSGPCLSELNITEKPVGWLETAITYLSNEANFAGTTGQFTTLAISNPTTLNFDLRRSNNPSAKTLYVEVSTTSQTTGFTTVGTFDHYNTNSSSTTNVTVDLSSYNTTSVVYIRFRKSSSTTSPWYLKNVEVFCAPSCIPPADPTGTINGSNVVCNSANLVYNFPGGTPGTAYWQSSATGTSLTNDAAFVYNVNTSGNYYVRNYNAETMCWSVNAEGPFPLTVNSPASITTQPANVSIASGANAAFSVAATNVASYQWQENTGSGFANITNGGVYSNVTTATLNITGATFAMNGYLYRCVLTANPSCGETNTASATLTVAAPLPAPVVTPQSPNGTVGVAFSTTISATNSPTSYAAGILPAGLVLNAATGVISGTPTAAGSFTVAVTASNGTASTPVDFTFSIAKGTPIFTTSPINMSIGNTYALPGANISSTSAGAYTYSITTGGSSTLSGSTITGVLVGTETLTVNQVSSANYNAGSTTVSVVVSTINYANGDYRSTNNGNWHGTAASGTTNTWEQLVSGTWTAISNSPPSSAASLGTKTVYIKNSIVLVGNNTAPNVVVENGGILNTSTITPTFGNISVKSGGTFSQDAYTKITGVLEVFDEGVYIFNSKNSSSRSTTVWNGSEKFHPNSTFKITNSDNSGTYNVIESSSDVDVFLNPSTGFSACFGNIIIDNSSGGAFQFIPENFTKNLAHGNVTFVSNASNKVIFAGNATTSIGGDFILDAGYNQTMSFLTTSSTANINIKGNLINNSTKTLRLLNNTAGTVNLTVDNNIQINSTGIIDINFTGGGSATINLKGDLTVGSSAQLLANNVITSTFNFLGIGDGLSASTTQTIDVANQSTSSNISFNVKSGAYAKLINQNFALGTSSKLTVENGGTLDFGFNGAIPLKLIKSSSSTGTAFESKEGSTLKISSPEGITSTGTSGNVQVVPSYTTFSALATFHYIGKVDQVTGTGVGTSTNGRAVIVELDSNALTLTPSTAFGITSALNTNINQNNGGILDIRKGRFVETATAFVDGSSSVSTSGKLKMAAGTLYKIVKESGTGDAEYIPRLANLELAGGEIELGAAGNQTLRGGKTYYNLSFSNGGTKSVSTGTPDINGLIYIDENTTLDGASSTIGKGSTDLLMNSNSVFKTGGSGSKPDAGGDYVLDPSSTIVFQGTSATTVRLGTPSIEYGTIIINGTNVSNDATIKGILMQAGTTFTVKDGKTFKLKNTAGFNGVAAGAINMSNTPTIALEANSTIEYVGATQTITAYVPGYQKLKISGTGEKTLGASLVKVNQDLNVTGSLLKIAANKALIVADGVVTVVTDAENATATTSAIAPTKGILIEDSGSLVQINEVENTGAIAVQRNSMPMVTADYTYWSAPVDNQSPSAFSAKTVQNTGNFLFWKHSIVNGIPTQGWSSALSETAMTAGKGYIIKTPVAATPTAFAGQFIGKPNNGTITIPTFGSTIDLAANYKWNLIGNPYPSAISATEFVMENNLAVDGTVYFWTHNTAPVGSLNSYEKADYAAWNILGGTATYEATTDNDALVDNKPNGFIASGQSFFVRGISNGDSSVTINNGMRRNDLGSNYSNSQFFRSAITEASTTTEPEKHRVWLNINGPTIGFRQTLVGYIANATNGLDHLYDGVSFGGNSLNLYSIAESSNLVIQGRALPFSNQDTVPLGYRSTQTGNLTISIDHVDGLMENQDIYLEDTVLNVVHDLKTTNYTFATVAGTFNTRFVLRYVPQENLSNPSFDQQVKAVRIYKNNANLFVHSPYETIATVSVYDLMGRLLFERKDCNTNRFETNNISANQQTLIVKVTLVNGGVVTEKVL